MEQIRASLTDFLGCFGTSKGFVQVLDVFETHRVLRMIVHEGFQRSFLDLFAEVSTESPAACGRALKAGQTVLISDVETDPQFEPFRPVCREAGFRAVLSMPIVSSWGHTVGIINTHFAEPQIRDESRIAEAGPIAKQLAHRILALLGPDSKLTAAGY